MFKLAAKNKVLELGTWATEFHPQIDVQEHDIFITKHRVSALYGTDLKAYITSK